MAKVLQIIPSLNKINGGVERGTLDVAKELINAGFESSILSSGGEMAEKYKYRGVEHYELNLKKKGIYNYFKVKRKIKKIINEVKPDIVHVRSRWPAFCFNKIIKQLRIPLVTTFHGTYSGNRFFLKKKYNSVMTEGDKVISISKFIDDHVRFYFPACKTRLIQINRGIDTDYFNLSSVTKIRKEKLLANFTLSENVHIILLPARITAWKGHLVAIEAAHLITKKDTSLNFVMLLVGGEDERNTFSKILKKKVKNSALRIEFYFVEI